MGSAKRAFWFEHLERIEREQLSYAEYARRESLNIKHLYSWNLRFKKRDAMPSNGVKLLSKARRTAPRFVAVQVARNLPLELEPASVGNLQLRCHLRLASGASLELMSLPPVAWLSSLEFALRANTGGGDARR